jgi:hypothetical protein
MDKDDLYINTFLSAISGVSSSTESIDKDGAEEIVNNAANIAVAAVEFHDAADQSSEDEKIVFATDEEIVEYLGETLSDENLVKAAEFLLEKAGFELETED